MKNSAKMRSFTSFVHEVKMQGTTSKAFLFSSSVFLCWNCCSSSKPRSSVSLRRSVCNSWRAAVKSFSLFSNSKLKSSKWHYVLNRTSIASDFGLLFFELASVKKVSFKSQLFSILKQFTSVQAKLKLSYLVPTKRYR